MVGASVVIGVSGVDNPGFSCIGVVFVLGHPLECGCVVGAFCGSSDGVGGSAGGGSGGGLAVVLLGEVEVV